jgi:hypothetical protein
LRTARLGGLSGPAHLLLLPGVAIKARLRVDRQVGAARAAALAADALIAVAGTAAPASAAAPRAPGARWPVALRRTLGRGVARLARFGRITLRLRTAWLVATWLIATRLVPARFIPTGRLAAWLVAAAFSVATRFEASLVAAAPIAVALGPTVATASTAAAAIAAFAMASTRFARRFALHRRRRTVLLGGDRFHGRRFKPALHAGKQSRARHRLGRRAVPYGGRGNYRRRRPGH